MVLEIWQSLHRWSLSFILWRIHHIPDNNPYPWVLILVRIAQDWLYTSTATHKILSRSINMTNFTSYHFMNVKNSSNVWTTYIFFMLLHVPTSMWHIAFRTTLPLSLWTSAKTFSCRFGPQILQYTLDKVCVNSLIPSIEYIHNPKL